MTAMNLKTLCKRLYHIPGMLLFEQRRLRLCLQGAEIARGAALAPLVAEGNKRNLRVGRHSFVGRITMHLHRPIDIGCNVVINDGVTIFTASHDPDSPDFAGTFSGVKIEDYAWVATGAMIMPGVTIGQGAVVGAGSVVTKSVPAYTIVAGNPARPIGSRATDLRYNPVGFVAQFEAWVSK